jgi:hypothetical protein
MTKSVFIVAAADNDDEDDDGPMVATSSSSSADRPSPMERGEEGGLLRMVGSLVCSLCFYAFPQIEK